MHRCPGALLALAAALLLAGCGTGGRAASDDTSGGAELFKKNCGSCHALKAAGTRGTIGPDLDNAFAGPRQEGYDEDTIRDVVLGQIRFAVPPMPTNLVEGEQAEAVAAYVASVVAKKLPPGQASSGGAGAGDPKSIFQSNCASCHTFAPAEATGSIGPKLDGTQLDVAAIAAQIRNGGGGMPPFKGVLTDKQIQALAKFISQR